ncbi:phospholipase D-like domain-containing protein [Bradyrhizobium genosp. A]|uniref:phospholipase D-like domain-containing protein n=1 Tax=Bradyrhizobium genosp. A TaxID=83626 RepID=UPI003CF7459A
MIKVNAYANCDHSFVVWTADQPIEDCLGFALYRLPAGQTSPEIAETFVGPSTQTKVPAGTKRPSTEWPIQKFTWSDYLVGSQTEVKYQVVAMCGPGFSSMKPGQKSDWSNSVSLTTPAGTAIQPYFNRGVVSTQWVARQLETTKKSLKQLVDPADGQTNKVRDFLGGVLKQALLDLLDMQCKAGAHIYASLFELNDPEVLPAIERFGQRAHIILSDGTHKVPAAKGKGAQKKKAKVAKKRGSAATFDENADARATLRAAHCEVHDRMVTGEHFSHHKFIVFTNSLDTTKPAAVWTGSTNLTYGGVCTQANNGILIKDETIATRFFQQWKKLVSMGDDYDETLAEFDQKPKTSVVAGAKVTAWFAPNPMIGAKPAKGKGNKYGDHPDLKYARQLIKNAQEGVLFLVFNPGYEGTLLNDVLDLLNNPTKNKKLYIHGVANQDPTGGRDKAPLIFVHRNKVERSKTDAEVDIVLPAAVRAPSAATAKDKKAAAALQDWVKLVSDYWQEEPSGLGMVRVHSKVIVVDPLGKHPAIITGSHNLGPKASAVNDDNLVIIENDTAAATAYAVNITTVYDQYRWRFQQVLAAEKHQPLNQFNGLTAPWTYQGSYFKDDKAKELKFWT